MKFHFPLETKETTFFAENMIEKCENLKSRGPWTPAPFPTPMIITWDSNLNLNLQNAAPRADVSPCPWLRHRLKDRIIRLLQVIQPNIPKLNQATKTVILTYS